MEKNLASTMKQTDVLIVGGGVIGVCCALEIVRQGREVVLLDKSDIGSECSFANAGVISPSHAVPLAAPGIVAKGLKWLLNPESPFYLKPRLDIDLALWLWRFYRAARHERMLRALTVMHDFLELSADMHESWAQKGGSSYQYHRNGLIQIYETAKGMTEARREFQLLSDHGIPVCEMNETQLKQNLGALPPTAQGAMFFPKDGHVEPALFVERTASKARDAGADLRSGVEVLGFQVTGRRITAVRTTQGEWSASEIILCGGAWTGELSRQLGLRLSLQPAKGYSITVSRPSGHPEIPFTVAESKVYITPMGKQLRFAGTLELAGMDFSVTQRRVNAILKVARRFVSWPKDDKGELWTGLRPCSPDGLPYIGRPRRYANLVLAVGHAMQGLTLGPGTGRLVAELVLGKRTSISSELLSPDRYS